jgi:hypothetical protein
MLTKKYLYKPAVIKYLISITVGHYLMTYLRYVLLIFNDLYLSKSMCE